MANVENRAAEHGSKIISDTDLHSFQQGKLPVAIRILEDTVIAVITSIGQYSTENVAYYQAKALATDSPVILANVNSIRLTSGAVQAIYS